MGRCLECGKKFDEGTGVAVLCQSCSTFMGHRSSHQWICIKGNLINMDKICGLKIGCYIPDSQYTCFIKYGGWNEVVELTKQEAEVLQLFIDRFIEYNGIFTIK